VESILEEIRNNMQQIMDIENCEINEFSFYCRGKFLVDTKTAREYIFNLGKSLDMTPFIDKEREFISVRFLNLKKPEKSSIIWNVVLLIVTFFSTLIAGTMNAGYNPLIVKNLIHGLSFSLSIMIILGGHELGHFFLARKNGVMATYPYFIPAPQIIGTFGAVIKIKSPIPSKDALVEIGAAGPITGFILAIIATIIGLKFSHIVPVKTIKGLTLGNNLIFFLLEGLVHPGLKSDFDLLIHPVAFSGWIGFLVTALNLLPVGQLDGGHISYAFFGKYHKYVSIAMIGLCLGLGMLWPGWIVWGILLVLIGWRHPPPLDNVTPLSMRSKVIGGVSLLIFILCLTPVPFKM